MTIRNDDTTDRPTPPKVFLSYSWTNPDYEQRVLDIATRLRSDGVDVILDKWDLKEGHDSYAFMERMVTDPSISKVLLLSDKAYAEKADKRRGGVGTETQIVSKDVYDKVTQDKFIPVLMQRDGEKACLPAYLGGRKYVDFSTAQAYVDNYEQLLRAIFNKPLHVKPSLGKMPASLDAVDAGSSGPLLRPVVDEYTTALYRGNITGGKLLFSRLVQRFGDSLESLIVESVPQGSYLDEVVLGKWKAFLETRNAYADALLAFIASNEGSNCSEPLAEAFELYLRKLKPARKDHDALLVGVYETLLHTIALLIKKERFQEASAILTREYLIHTDMGIRPKTLWKHRFVPASIQQDRNTRLGANRISALADLIHERPGHPQVSYADLVQADLAIFIRAITAGHFWYPHLLIHSERLGPLEVFVRARSKPFFQRLLPLLGASNKAELKANLEKGLKQFDMRGDRAFFDLNEQVSSHMNWDDLGTV